MTQLLASILILSGAATAYGPGYYGQPLYCDRGASNTLQLGQGNGLILGEVDTPFVALDVSEYQSGRVRCGDMMRLTFADGQVLEAQALDAGNLYRYRIDELRAYIIVDVPFQFAPFSKRSGDPKSPEWTGLSAPATIRNLSAFRRLAAKVIPQ